MSSHSASNSQKHKSKLPSCCLLFCLPICLKSERDEESSLDAKEVTKQEPKLGYKNHSLVINNRVWEVVMLYHHVYNYFR